MGLGGNCSSLAPAKDKPQVKVASTGIMRCRVKKHEATLFKKYYDRGDMPITVNFNGADRKIGWKLEPEHIDYHLYLPIFFEGMRETEEPYKFLADRVLHFIIGLHSADRTRRIKIGGGSSPADYSHQK